MAIQQPSRTAQPLEAGGLLGLRPFVVPGAAKHQSVVADSQLQSAHLEAHPEWVSGAPSADGSQAGEGIAGNGGSEIEIGRTGLPRPVAMLADDGLYEQRADLVPRLRDTDLLTVILPQASQVRS